MRHELKCVFNTEIDEGLRKQLAEGKLTKDAEAAAFHELRGVAMLELGHLDIELNINALENEEHGIEAATPTLDYFICVKGEERGIWDGWENYGYADDYIGDAGHAHVDWGAENWEELLFTDMLHSLAIFAGARREKENLKFLTANDN